MVDLNISEVLITGYDGSDAAFAMSLSRGHTKMVFTAGGPDGPMVESVLEVVTPAFEALLRVLEDLWASSGAPASVASK